jgi:anti-sigma factor RsiW
MIRDWLERRRYMREHHWTHAHLSEYLDGELAPDAQRRAEAHISICPHCTRVLATLKAAVRSLGDLMAEPRPSVADGVIERLREEP